MEKRDAFVKEIVAYLDDWVFVPGTNRNGAMVAGPNGEEMILRVSRERGQERVTVYGLYACHRREFCGDPEYPRISVAADKMPERIAKEIERRFMPAFEDLWEILKKRGDEEIADAAACMEGARKLADILGVEVGEYNHKDKPVAKSRRSVAYLSTEVISGGKQATLNFRNCSVPFELAETIVRAVAEYDKEHPDAQ